MPARGNAKIDPRRECAGRSPGRVGGHSDERAVRAYGDHRSAPAASIAARLRRRLQRAYGDDAASTGTHAAISDVLPTLSVTVAARNPRGGMPFSLAL